MLPNFFNKRRRSSREEMGRVPRARGVEHRILGLFRSRVPAYSSIKSETEFEALLRMFESWQREEYESSDGISRTAPPAESWCDVPINLENVNFRVRRLVLARRSLGGALPRKLGDLIGLQVVDLSHNCLTGPILPELGRKSLTEINLSHNQLSGPFPPELGRNSLTELNLSHNQLSGSITLEPKLFSVRKLNLSHNQLSGRIRLRRQAELPGGLVEIDLSHNQVSGSIPPELGRTFSLTKVDLSHNQLSGSIPPELGGWNRLTKLDLSHNQLSGSIPPELGRTFSLTKLDLSHNQLSGSIPSELGINIWRSKLGLLHLGSNKLTGPIPPTFGRLVSLTALYLHANRLTGPIPPELGNLPSLRRLSLQGNRISGSIPRKLGNLWSLTYLDLRRNRLTGKLPVEIVLLPMLTACLQNNYLDPKPEPRSANDATFSRIGYDPQFTTKHKQGPETCPATDATVSRVRNVCPNQATSAFNEGPETCPATDATAIRVRNVPRNGTTSAVNEAKRELFSRRRSEATAHDNTQGGKIAEMEATIAQMATKMEVLGGNMTAATDTMKGLVADVQSLKADGAAKTEAATDLVPDVLATQGSPIATTTIQAPAFARVSPGAILGGNEGSIERQIDALTSALGTIAVEMRTLNSLLGAQLSTSGDNDSSTPLSDRKKPPKKRGKFFLGLARMNRRRATGPRRGDDKKC